jgi:hypothetical protein
VEATWRAHSSMAVLSISLGRKGRDGHGSAEPAGHQPREHAGGARNPAAFAQSARRAPCWLRGPHRSWPTLQSEPCWA